MTANDDEFTPEEVTLMQDAVVAMAVAVDLELWTARRATYNGEEHIVICVQAEPQDGNGVHIVPLFFLINDDMMKNITPPEGAQLTTVHRET